jgi:alpha-L-fucosidase
MKILINALAALFIATSTLSQTPPPDYMREYNSSRQRTEWMTDARFGMFIHFGAYAVPARGEWVKTTERMTNEEYQKYVDVFNPVDCDMSEWARLAKEAGMKYAVMTAKHHDGFCLFDSRLTDYSTGKTIGRDLVKEFLDAFRAEGLKVGLYYSLIDWHHPDYPKYKHPNHPMRDREEFREEKINWDNYLKYMHGQVEELTTRYGRLDIMWFDFSYGEMTGEKWQARKLVDMVRKNQPWIILNNRLQASGEGVIGLRDFYLGDFDTPEQGVPEQEMKDQFGNPLRWETCLTLNNNWGYAQNDHAWKSPTLVIQTLIDIVSKNGNLLLNVGPDGRGNIPPESVAILKKVGEWMKLNSESIYGCGRSDLETPSWGRITQKDNTLYLHWMYPKIGYLNMKGFADKAKAVTVLSTGAEAFTAKEWWGNRHEENFLINFNTPIYHTFPLPDPHSTVIKLELK